jgi:hypothetical protein
MSGMTTGAEAAYLQYDGFAELRPERLEDQCGVCRDDLAVDHAEMLGKVGSKACRSPK